VRLTEKKIAPAKGVTKPTLAVAGFGFFTSAPNNDGGDILYFKSVCLRARKTEGSSQALYFPSADSPPVYGLPHQKLC